MVVHGTAELNSLNVVTEYGWVIEPVKKVGETRSHKNYYRMTLINHNPVLTYVKYFDEQQDGLIWLEQFGTSAIPAEQLKDWEPSYNVKYEQ